MRKPREITAEERQRWEDGRHDWKDEKWQDHCGDPNCERCHGFIPINPRIAELREKFHGWIPL